MVFPRLTLPGFPGRDSPLSLEKKAGRGSSEVLGFPLCVFTCRMFRRGDAVPDS